jgi:hypothetical protein
MGSDGLSAAAAELEEAGKRADTGTITQKLPVFAGNLKTLCAAINAVLKPANAAAANVAPHAGNAGSSVSHTDGAGKANAVNGAALKNALTALKSALESKDIESIDRLMEELEKMPADAKTQEGFEKIADHILLGEYDLAVNALGSFFQGGA